MASDGTAHYEITGNSSGLIGAARSGERAMAGLGTNGTKSGQMLSSALGAAGDAMGSIGGGSGLAGINTAGAALSRLAGVAGPVGVALAAMAGAATVAGMALKEAMSTERIETGINTILKDATLTKAVMAQMQKLAAETPLEMSDLAGGAKGLLGAGSGVRDLWSELKMLGDIASGAQVPLERVRLVYDQIRSAGKLNGGDMMQLNSMGVAGLREELSKVAKIDVSQFSKQLEAGNISASMVAQAFRNMTQEGGIFFDAMKNDSRTTSGLLSTLSDDLNGLLRVIGTPINDMIKPTIMGWSAALQEATNGVGTLMQAMALAQKEGKLMPFLFGREENFDGFMAKAVWNQQQEKKKQEEAMKNAPAGKPLADAVADDKQKAAKVPKAPKAPTIKAEHWLKGDENHDGIISKREKRAQDLADQRAQRHADSSKGFSYGANGLGKGNEYEGLAGLRRLQVRDKFLVDTGRGYKEEIMGGRSHGAFFNGSAAVKRQMDRVNGPGAKGTAKDPTALMNEQLGELKQMGATLLRVDRVLAGVGGGAN